MAVNRMERINSEILRLVSELMRTQFTDYMVSVTHVETTSDLQYSKIHVSIYGADATQALKEVNAKSGVFRHHLAKNLNIRQVPELKFVLDDSMEYSAKINQIIQEIHKKENRD